MKMSRGISLGGSAAVARSLKVTRATHGVVAIVNAAVAANAIVAMGPMGLVGQAVLIAIVFASVTATAFAVCTDIFNRSSQTVANLRSIGATTGSLSSALLFSTISYGSAGSALGAAAGAALGAGLGAGLVAVPLLIEVVAVVIASSAATAVGVYAGARMSWRS
jgi:hypothetical protein